MSNPSVNIKTIIQNTISEPKTSSPVFLLIQSLVQCLVQGFSNVCFTTQCNQNKTFEKPTLMYMYEQYHSGCSDSKKFLSTIDAPPGVLGISI